jgi:5-formyltetrahydrofolate cyclo-ligase
VTVEAAKAAARSAMRAALAGMPDADRASAREAIAREALDAIRGLGLPVGAVIGLFAPTPQEAGALELGPALRACGFVTAYPRVVQPSALAYHPVAGEDALRPGFRGLAEPPAESPVIAPEALLVLLVPGLAFDPGGGRLGRGGGFYDRLLEGVPRSVPRLGVAFACQVAADPLPVGPHDARVDAIVSEAGLKPTPRWPMGGPVGKT